MPHRDDQAPQQGADRCSYRCPGMDTEERRIGQRIFEERLRDESTNAQPSADKQRGEQTGEPEIRHDDPRAFCRFPAQEGRHDIANRNRDTAAAQSHKRSAGTRASKHSGKTDRRVLSMSRNDGRMEERTARNVRSLRRPGMCISAYDQPPQRNGVKRLSAQAAPGTNDAGFASFFPSCSTCCHARKRSEGAKGVSS